jgi:general stress protein YciG
LRGVFICNAGAHPYTVFGRRKKAMRDHEKEFEAAKAKAKSIREAKQISGLKGGKACAEKMGREHMRAIGRLGGQALARSRGREWMSAIGKKGGETQHMAKRKM